MNFTSSECDKIVEQTKSGLIDIIIKMIEEEALFFDRSGKLAANCIIRKITNIEILNVPQQKDTP